MEKPEADYKFGYDENVPADISEIFIFLCQELSTLQGKWDLYKVLFDPKNDGILNSLASYAFYLIRDSLFNEVVLGLCRLGDPEIMKSGEKNLCFKTIVNRTKGSNPSIYTQYTNFISLSGQIRAFRNKEIGHNDLLTHTKDPDYALWIRKPYNEPVSISDIDELFTSASIILNSILDLYSHINLDFHPLSYHDGKALVHWLDIAHIEQVKQWNRPK